VVRVRVAEFVSLTDAYLWQLVAETSRTRRPVARNALIASARTMVLPVPGGPQTRRTPAGEDLAIPAWLIADGRLRRQIGRTGDWTQTAEALAALARRSFPGKAVLTVPHQA
jgi:hypothetical protein